MYTSGVRRKGVRIWHGMRGRGRWAPDTAPIFTNTNTKSCHSHQQLFTHTGKKNINANCSAKGSLKIVHFDLLEIFTNRHSAIMGTATEKTKWEHTSKTHLSRNFQAATSRDVYLFSSWIFIGHPTFAQDPLFCIPVLQTWPLWAGRGWRAILAKHHLANSASFAL